MDNLDDFNAGLYAGHTLGQKTAWNKVSDCISSLPPNGRVVVGIYNVGGFAIARIVERIDGTDEPKTDDCPFGWVIRFYTAIGEVQRVGIPQYWIDLPDPNDYE